jgi:hypothetical protein
VVSLLVTSHGRENGIFLFAEEKLLGCFRPIFLPITVLASVKWRDLAEDGWPNVSENMNGSIDYHSQHNYSPVGIAPESSMTWGRNGGFGRYGQNESVRVFQFYAEPKAR